MAKVWEQITGFLLRKRKGYTKEPSGTREKNKSGLEKGGGKRIEKRGSGRTLS